MYSEARGWDARDMPFGGALPWPPSPKFTGMPNCEVTPEEKALQSANPALARRLGVTSTVRADADAYWQTKKPGECCGTSDIFQASREGNLPRLLYLLDVDRIPVTRTRWSGITALHRAAEEGHVACLALLLERGPPGYIDTKTSNGWYTPLHLACGRGHSEAANYLMEQGARWSICDKHLRTPLDWAIKSGFIEMARQLDQKYEALMEAQREATSAQRKEEAARQAEIEEAARDARLGLLPARKKPNKKNKEST